MSPSHTAPVPVSEGASKMVNEGVGEKPKRDEASHASESDGRASRQTAKERRLRAVVHGACAYSGYYEPHRSHQSLLAQQARSAVPKSQLPHDPAALRGQRRTTPVTDSGQQADAKQDYREEWEKGYETWRRRVGRKMTLLSRAHQLPAPPVLPPPSLSDDSEPLLAHAEEPRLDIEPETHHPPSERRIFIVAAIALLIPVLTSFTVEEAAYSALAIVVGAGLPALGVAMFMLTPLDIEEHPPAKDEAYRLLNESPAAILVRTGESINDVRGQVASRLASGMAALTAPFADSLAKLMQLSMGVAAILQIPKTASQLTSGGPVAAGIIQIICMVVQLPDSFSWLFNNVACMAALILWFHRKIVAMEVMTVAASTELARRLEPLLHARAVRTADSAAASANRPSARPTAQRSSACSKLIACISVWMEYSLHCLLVRLNDVGSLVRHSPLKSYVVMLNMIGVRTIEAARRRSRLRHRAPARANLTRLWRARVPVCSCSQLWRMSSPYRPGSKSLESQLPRRPSFLRFWPRWLRSVRPWSCTNGRTVSYFR